LLTETIIVLNSLKISSFEILEICIWISSKIIFTNYVFVFYLRSIVLYDFLSFVLKLSLKIKNVHQVFDHLENRSKII